MKEIVFQRDALEQEIRLARTRSARLASEPPPPAIKWISDSHRRLSEKLIKEISEQPLRSPEECIAQLERLAKKQPPLVQVRWLPVSAAVVPPSCSSLPAQQVTLLTTVP